MATREIISQQGAPAKADTPDGCDVSFFIPCYNEENNVVNAIEKLIKTSQICHLTYEILVFDDCSQDRTVEVVQNYQRAHPDVPLRLFVNEVNRGVSHNFFEGSFHASGTYYRLVCGDDCEPVETLTKILANLRKTDIVIPYHTEIGGRPLYRHIISKVYTRFVNVASGNNIHYYNGCPVYLRRDVQRYHVEATGFGYQAEFLTRLLYEGRSYVEVPVVSIDREGSGSLNFRNFMSVGHSLLKIALRRLRVHLFK